MNRRTATQTAAVALLTGVAGCLTAEESREEPAETDGNEIDHPQPDDSPDNETTSPENGSTDTGTEMIDSDRVDGATFTPTGDCDETGTATIEFSDAGPEATITGCLTAHNGCAEPVFGSVDAETDVFRVVIGEEDRSGPGTVCTEALVDRGYELTLRFVEEFPATIEVVHDDAEGRAVVTTVDRP
jgi:hypothetical protein